MFQPLLSLNHFFLEHVGQGHNLRRRAFDIEGINRRPAPAAAAADQHDLNRVVLGRMDARHGHAGQSGSGGNFAAVLEKFATRGARLRGRIRHGFHLGREL
jgi:hypothetical protein